MRRLDSTAEIIEKKIIYSHQAKKHIKQFNFFNFNHEIAPWIIGTISPWGYDLVGIKNETKQKKKSKHSVKHMMSYEQVENDCYFLLLATTFSNLFQLII